MMSHAINSSNWVCYKTHSIIKCIMLYDIDGGNNSICWFISSNLNFIIFRVWLEIVLFVDVNFFGSMRLIRKFNENFEIYIGWLFLKSPKKWNAEFRSIKVCFRGWNFAKYFKKFSECGRNYEKLCWVDNTSKLWKMLKKWLKSLKGETFFQIWTNIVETHVKTEKKL